MRDHLPGTTSRGGPAEDRSTRDAREGRRFAGKLVDRVFFVWSIEIDSTMLDEPKPRSARMKTPSTARQSFAKAILSH
jgi:hypothetical protein